MSEDEAIAATMDDPGGQDCPHPGDCTGDSDCPCFTDKPSRQRFYRYGDCDCPDAFCPCQEYSSRRAAKAAGT